jgi:hypothetical protein
MSEIDFDSLNLKIPAIVRTLPIEKQQEVFEYLSSLDDINRTAYSIAYDHLGTSFSITRSNGFKEWLEHKNKSNS